ncbi:Fe(3+) ABC transporter substrate-binding protein [Hyphomicrobium sp. LHD-15]|uniref:Fe(3+) ABC transporter substrate-binding protein n=1 Tax=Hyphomicrobium sp. LHD-15 TaxID=3072142 RepID=UPI00280EED54|nr:Fe(3+) ABC transporter substrate-binding protein [Hyphomicrobium sp. LHD-15]MDQ8698426.1 Fe(3+) ABC transporter substrate-binding protein [Hyphomicrobium sp. LHD-15]
MTFSRPHLRTAARALSAPILALAALAAYGTDVRAEEEVNIYSYREPGLIEPVLKEFTKETGIKANVVFSKDGLIERMTAEGRNSPADVLLVNESGLLFKAKEAGVTQPLDSKVISEKVDAKLRDPERHWFAVTQRARVVYASKDRVKQDAISYEELADPKWKGKICTRSGQHTYNIALIASIIAHDGEEKAEAWLTGVRDNLARKPAGGDREGVRDVQAGLCDLAIGNTYYMVAMLKNPEQKAWADSVKILFPNAADRGTHVNISGAALAANAPHKDNAAKLLEFLVSHNAQELYAEQTGEYPVVADAHASDLVKSWGELKADPIALSELAKLRKKASELVDKVRFDAGPSS